MSEKPRPQSTARTKKRAYRLLLTLRVATVLSQRPGTSTGVHQHGGERCPAGLYIGVVRPPPNSDRAPRLPFVIHALTEHDQKKKEKKRKKSRKKRGRSTRKGILTARGRWFRCMYCVRRPNSGSSPGSEGPSTFVHRERYTRYGRMVQFFRFGVWSSFRARFGEVSRTLMPRRLARRPPYPSLVPPPPAGQRDLGSCYTHHGTYAKQLSPHPTHLSACILVTDVSYTSTMKSCAAAQGAVFGWSRVLCLAPQVALSS